MSLAPHTPWTDPDSPEATAHRLVNRPTEFDATRRDGVRCMVRRGWFRSGENSTPQQLLTTLMQLGGSVLRLGGGRGTTRCVELDGRTVFCKVYTTRTMGERLGNLVRRGHAIRELDCNCAVDAAGVPTAPIVAALSRRSFFGDVQIVVSEPAPGHSLLSILREQLTTTETRTPLLRDLGRFMADLHDHRVACRHLHGKHIFYDAQAGFTVIDLDGAHVYPWRWMLAPSRRRNLRDMERHLARVCTPEEIQIFLQSYHEATMELSLR
jgi:hypothetical protein